MKMNPTSRGLVDYQNTEEEHTLLLRCGAGFWISFIVRAQHNILAGDVGRYISSCIACRKTKPGKERSRGLERSHPTTWPFDLIYTDLWKTSYCGNETIFLTIIDGFTRWVEVISVPDESASSIASALMTGWI
eukprot:GHVO01040879.1.p1 GENE.GHVO01040879.1~~GHVO01040879.1.p1  ORF type:complete len:133 (-),score=6.41 GHVO01040879.1:317-715(-)